MAYPPVIFATQPAGNVNASLLDDNFAAAAPLDSPILTGTPQAPTPTQGDSSTNIATTEFVQGATANGAATRQTVANGPLTTAGLPDFLPASSVNLNLTSQNITAPAPLIVTAANGWSSAGAPSNRVGVRTTNLTWAGLTDATTNYLYVTVAADGTMTAGFTTVAPVYQWGGTPAVTNNLFTFNIAAMQGFFGNGVSAPQSYIVFVGEAVTAAGAVTSTVAYAYNGQFESAFTNTLPASATAVTATHGIGVVPRMIDWIIENISTEINYAVGDQLHYTSIITNPGAAAFTDPALSTSTTVMSLIGIDSGSGVWNVLNKTTGAFTTVTNNKWKYKFVARRGW